MILMNTSGELLWKNELLIGFEPINKQHQEIFNAVNKFIEEIESHHPASSRFAELLSKLMDVGLVHFKEEEKDMSAHNYPKLAEHIKLHKAYIYKIAIFNANFLKYEPKALEEVIEFLKDWWVNHIKTMDMDYKNYMQNKKMRL